MPIVNGAYVAPTWNNDAPPAINAAELQDICDTIETYNTSKADVDYVNTFVRPNLLDNAYFVGGGSQQGNGQFPVNQQGSTAYNSTGYTIDRWQVGISNAVSIQSDSVKISDSSGGHQSWKIFTQKIPNAGQYRGKTLTMSILCGDTVTAGLAKPLIRIENNGSFVNQTMGDFLSANGLATVTWTIPTSGTFDTVVAGIMETTSGTGSYKIIAMKLEIGDTQSLAHQENGVWVLNEIPNFEQELAKCQMLDFWVRNTSVSTKYAYAIGMTIHNAASYVNAIAYTPVPMRTLPTVSHASCDVYRFTNGNRVSIADSASFTAFSAAENAVGLSIQAATGMTADETVLIEILPGGYIHFDANL